MSIAGIVVIALLCTTGDGGAIAAPSARIADHRNFYKVEQWSRDGQRVERMLFAGNSLDRARAIFKAEIRRRPRGHYTIWQRSRVLDQWSPQD